MRFKSAKSGPYQVLAVSGTNTISFAISVDKAGTKGLLGLPSSAAIPRQARLLRLRLQGLPLGDPQARRQELGEDLAPSGAELRVGRLHRQARPQVRIHFPSAQGHVQEAPHGFLDETDGWLVAYKPGSLKQKRVDMFRRMKGFSDPWKGPSFKLPGGPPL